MATVRRERPKSSNTKTTAATPEVAQVTTHEVAKVTTQTVDIQHAIRARAYELYQQRGGSDGHDHEDWLRAETEVLAHFGAQ